MDYLKNKRTIMKYFMKPVFEQNHYFLEKIHGEGTICFTNKENQYIKIEFIMVPMMKNSLETHIIHPKLPKDIFFPCFIYGPDNIKWNGGRWMDYYSIDDLLGLIEYQTLKFQEWIFDFLSGKKYNDQFEIIRKKRLADIEHYLKLSEKERFEDSEPIRKENREISFYRYKPINWTIENYINRKINKN